MLFGKAIRAIEAIKALDIVKDDLHGPFFERFCGYCLSSLSLSQAWE
jgi:hypothetical protein